MNLTFALPEPAKTDLEAISPIWGTFYYVKMAARVANGVPLKDMAGGDLGPQLSRKSWCLAGIEGTVGIKEADGTITIYNYAGKRGSSQTSCDGFSGLSDPLVRALEKTRWKPAKGPFGDGAGGYVLAPYRTLAVDRATFPLGSVIYLPDARGVGLTLPDGTTATHDGYFFAGDVGGAIKGRHVDFFIGVREKNPFSFVTSSSSGKIPARRVVNAQTISWLKTLHRN